MRAVSGRFAEARVYLCHCVAVVRPGADVPVFAEPAVYGGDLSGFRDEDLKLVIEEGRRQLDRQQGDLERMRTRAATLVTVALVEIALLSNGARRAFADGAWEAAGWAIAAASVILGLAGAGAVLTVKAELGRTDTVRTAELDAPVLKPLALAYAQQTGYGEETVRTRLTVLRGAIVLLVAGALLYACLWPFTR